MQSSFSISKAVIKMLGISDTLHHPGHPLSYQFNGSKTQRGTKGSSPASSSENTKEEGTKGSLSMSEEWTLCAEGSARPGESTGHGLSCPPSWLVLSIRSTLKLHRSNVQNDATKCAKGFLKCVHYRVQMQKVWQVVPISFAPPAVQYHLSYTLSNIVLPALLALISPFRRNVVFFKPTSL